MRNRSAGAGAEAQASSPAGSNSVPYFFSRALDAMEQAGTPAFPAAADRLRAMLVTEGKSDFLRSAADSLFSDFRLSFAVTNHVCEEAIASGNPST